MSLLNIFTGHEDRVAIGTHVFVQSVLDHAKSPVSIAPITRIATPGHSEGSNAFTARRFLVPHAMGRCGFALFCDGADMLARADINEVLQYASHRHAVMVVKHHYKTRNVRKYRGTAMESDNEDYERKQWAAVMLFNCRHPVWIDVTPEFVKKTPVIDLLQFRFLPEELIGELPMEWNWLADEHGENQAAKLLHFTAGVPAIPAHASGPMADEWIATRARAMSATGGAS
jgi:hypothetical protein